MTSFLRLIATIALALELPLAVLVASEPTVNSIDYSNPEAYTAISDTLGSAQAIAEQASALKGNDARATIRNVLEWMDANLSYDGTKAYEWRNYDTVVEQGCYGGCADQAIVCGVLLKAAGVPTVWVKTMDVPWIWDLKKGRSFKSWSGHVFLEVYLDDQWVLLDPGGKADLHELLTRVANSSGKSFCLPQRQRSAADGHVAAMGAMEGADKLVLLATRRLNAAG